MSPIGRMLVAFDGSDKDAAALEWALAIAHPLGACVEVVHALGLRESSHRPTDDGSESAHDRAIRETGEAMRRAIDTVRGSDPRDVALTVLSGHPALLLLREIEARRPDLVVVGRRRSSLASADALGSVSREIASRSDVPVVVVPPAAPTDTPSATPAP